MPFEPPDLRRGLLSGAGSYIGEGTALCVIVDDHEDTRRGFAEYFQVSGFDVLTAASAREFDAILEAHRPDVIVLDLQLPEVDGWELGRRIRSMPALQGVPLIAFSACVMPDERARAEEAGFDLFLTKPCDPEIILREVRRLVALRALT